MELSLEYLLIIYFSSHKVKFSHLILVTVFESSKWLKETITILVLYIAIATSLIIIVKIPSIASAPISAAIVIRIIYRIHTRSKKRVLKR